MCALEALNFQLESARHYRGEVSTRCQGQSPVQPTPDRLNNCRPGVHVYPNVRFRSGQLSKADNNCPYRFGINMSDRRTNDVVEIALEYAILITRTGGVAQALEYLDRHCIDRVLFWRMLSEPEHSRRRDRREAVRADIPV